MRFKYDSLMKQVTHNTEPFGLMTGPTALLAVSSLQTLNI